MGVCVCVCMHGCVRVGVSLLHLGGIKDLITMYSSDIELSFCFSFMFVNFC